MKIGHLLAELEQVNQRDLLERTLADADPRPNAERAAGLAFLEARRRELGPAKLYDERGESWGYAAVAVPELDMQVHYARNPDLRSKDRTTRYKAWMRFLRDFGGHYGCDASVGKTKRNTGIIVR